MRSLLSLTVIILFISPAAGATISPANLKLVGGYRVSRFSKWDDVKPDIAYRTTGYPYGGMHCRTEEDGTLRVWHENGEQGRQVLESYSAGPMGSAGIAPTRWPLLKEGNVWGLFQLFPEVKLSQYMIPLGMCYDPEVSKLYVSLRSRYATSPDPSQWVAAVNYPDRTVDPATKLKPKARAQRFGGGMTLIPQKWADQYTGGHRLAFVSGGLTSGQGGSAGPTFGVLNRETGEVQKLMYFVDNATINADKNGKPPYETKQQCERAFTDYGPVAPGWAWGPEDTNGDGELDTGYFATSSLRGGGTWIDHGDYQCVAYTCTQPTGEVIYKYQEENLCRTRACNLYVYDPADLERVAKGELQPWQMRGEFYRWTAKVNGGIPGIVRSLCWDPASGLLAMYYVKVWQAGKERYPVVAFYEIVDD